MFADYEQFWSVILDDPKAASAMLGRDPYPRELTYAQLAAESPHLVLSTTLSEATWPTARIVSNIDDIRALRQQPREAVYVVGGPRLVASLIAADLLDELHLIVHPVLLGGGTSFLGATVPRRALDLVAAEPTARGRVLLTYGLRASTASSSERAHASTSRA